MNSRCGCRGQRQRSSNCSPERASSPGVPVSRFYPDNDALADLLLIAATEMTTAEDMDRLEAALREVLS